MYEKTFTTFEMLKDLGIKSTDLLKEIVTDIVLERRDHTGYSGYFVGSDNTNFNIALIFEDFINFYIYGIFGKGNFKIISVQKLHK